MRIPSQDDIIIMIDSETLDTVSTAVVTQLAFMAVPAAAPDPINALKFDSYFLPWQPQLDAGRTVSASTLAYWLRAPDDARLKLIESMDGDNAVLTAFVRSFIRKISQVIQACPGNTEIWARGPVFDVSIIDSLIAMCGEVPPWHYGSIRDVRTAMSMAGIDVKDIPSDDIVKHIALEDCRFQLRCIDAVQKSMAGEEIPEA